MPALSDDLRQRILSYLLRDIAYAWVDPRVKVR